MGRTGAPCTPGAARFSKLLVGSRAHLGKTPQKGCDHAPAAQPASAGPSGFFRAGKETQGSSWVAEHHHEPASLGQIPLITF